MKVNNSFDEARREAIWFQNVANSCDASQPAAGCVPVLGIVAGGNLGAGASATRSYLHGLSHAVPLLRGIRSHFVGSCAVCPPLHCVAAVPQPSLKRISRFR